MPDDMTHDTTRLDAALRAMQDVPPVAPDVSARVAARAVLANAPMARATTWTMRAAAVLTVVALGAAAMASARVLGRPTQRAMAPTTVASDAGPTGVRVMPVMATSARPIVFEFDAPAAHSVQVLGDFNQWSRTASAMERGADGRWRITTMLPPGRYVYAFLVDGQSFRSDPLRERIEDRDFGVTGSELVVGEAP